MAKVDALDLGKRAFSRDQERMKNAPHLLHIKLKKVLVSPFAFLRGHAPTFYSILEQAPDLEDGPAGEGIIVGDAHIENFGAYRVRRAGGGRVGGGGKGKAKRHGGTAKKAHAGRPGAKAKVVAFDVNDFDDTCYGPHRYDIVRLATSLLLAARIYGEPGHATLDLLARLLDGYGAGAFGGTPPKAPESVRKLIARVEGRTAHEFLDARTTGQKGRRRFVLGERYFPLQKGTVAALPKALERYAAGLPEDERPTPAELAVVDAAFRVAGNGSLGCLRIAALVRGGDDGWLFDLKEEDVRPSPHRLVKIRQKNPVDRVLEGFLASVDRPPSRLGRTTLQETPMLVRRLTPQEDKLDVAELTRDAFVALVPYLGSLLGAAHARSAEKTPKVTARAHRRVDQTDLADRAIVIAGLHETAFLAYAREASKVTSDKSRT